MVEHLPAEVGIGYDGKNKRIGPRPLCVKSILWSYLKIARAPLYPVPQAVVVAFVGREIIDQKLERFVGIRCSCYSPVSVDAGSSAVLHISLNACVGDHVQHYGMIRWASQ